MKLREIKILMLLYLLFILFGDSEYSFCYFYNLTHLPCPGCGLTRAIRYLLNGEFLLALKYHFFSFFVFFVISLVLLSFVVKKIDFYLELILKQKFLIIIFLFLILLYGILRIVMLLKYPHIYEKYFAKIESKTWIDFYESIQTFF